MSASIDTSATPPAPVPAGPAAPATAPAPASALRAPAADARVVIARLDGSTVAIPLAVALSRGLVVPVRDGLRLTMAGARLASGPGSGLPVAQSTRIVAAPRTNRISRPLWETSSVAFLGSNVLQIAGGMGRWRTWYWPIDTLDRYSGRRLLPRWLSSGPLADAVAVAAGVSLVRSDLPGAVEAARRVARGARLGSHMPESVFSRPPARPGFTGFAARYAGPATQFALAWMAAAGIAELCERIAHHGVDGMLTSRAGRSALGSAAMGASFLWTIGAPVTVGGHLAWLAGSLLWTFYEANSRGWFDAIDRAAATGRRADGNPGASARRLAT